MVHYAQLQQCSAICTLGMHMPTVVLMCGIQLLINVHVLYSNNSSHTSDVALSLSRHASIFSFVTAFKRERERERGRVCEDMSLELVYQSHLILLP